MSLDKATQAHKTAGLVYCLWLLGILFGITAIIGIYINHIKLSSVRGTHAYSHFIWQIVSFWSVFALAVISFVLWPGTIARYMALSCFALWIFSGLIGSWYLSRSRSLNFFHRNPRAVKHSHHLRHETFDAEKNI